LIVAAIGVVLLAVALPTSQAQSSSPPPTITVGQVLAVTHTSSCDGTTTDSPGSVRLDRSGSIDDVVEVAYTFDGQSGSVTFAGAQTSARVEFDHGGQFALVAGPGYEVGTPSDGEVLTAVGGPSCAAPIPVLTDIPTNHSQSIDLGGQPVALELNDGILDVAIVQGRLPNGLSLHPDGTWSGTADETGEFPITLCFADPVCAAHGPWEFTLTVAPHTQALPRTGAFTVELVAAGLALIVLGIALRRPVIARLR